MNTRQPWYLRLPFWPGILVVAILVLTVAAGSLLLYSTVRAGGLFRPAGPTSTATPQGPPTIELSSSEGAPGTLMQVTGANWTPDDTVILSLDTPDGGRAPAINPDGLIAVGKATGDGRISESFVYPSEDRWANAARVFVVARSQSTGQLATAEFRPLPPTATIQPSPTEAPPVVFPTALPTQTPATACTDRLSFVADVTIPDSSNMQPGRSFVKTWRIRNTGTCTWLPSYDMVFTGGSAMGAPSAVPLGRSVFPGDSVDLSLSLKAPSAAGTYRGNWMLRSASGGLFGLGANANQPFWVQIVVGPVGSTGNGTWKGEYHADRTLSGTPRVVRQDVVIDFDWGRGQPHADIPADDFAVRWTGKASFDAATYRFKVLADDGVRLWIDDVLVLDQWKDQSAAEYTVDVALANGTHSLRLEYYERSHDARVRLRWERQPASSFADWKGEYFANRDLNGTPALVRNDRVVDYNWRGSAPTAGLPVDNFSARWTRKISFQPGTHRFIVRADDGVRVYVDGQRIIDEWHDASGSQDYVTHVTLSGQKTVVVEYYERAGNALIAFDIELVASTPTPTTSPTPTASPTPTPTAEPSATPTSDPTATPTATPVTDPEGGLSQVLDLGADACAAEWRNDEGLVLACPGDAGSLSGWVLVEGPSTLEDGVSYQGPVVAMGAGATAADTVSGRYAAREFGAGERFRARLGCPYGGTSCSYVFRLAYQDGNGDTHVLASWEETYDGVARLVDIDLAPLSGLTVSLVLEVEALADGLTASALWVRPRIVG